MGMDVALATCAEFPGLSPDDQPLLEELRRRGLKSEPVVWNAPGFDWSQPKLCILRNTWDYSTRHREFLGWIDAVSRATVLWNPAGVVRWNSHKTYLRDLQERGIPIAPTVWLEAGSRASLTELRAGQGWEEAVIKPAVSGTARATIRTARYSPQAAQNHLDRLLAVEDVLVQRYIGSVESRGELSLIFLEGRFSHAVRKRAAAGDFRVLEEWGGSTVPASPSSEELEFAEGVLRAAGFETLYGRVDLWEDDNGRLLVSELELVEPELYFRYAPEAAGRLAGGIEALYRL